MCLRGAGIVFILSLINTDNVHVPSRARVLVVGRVCSCVVCGADLSIQFRSKIISL